MIDKLKIHKFKILGGILGVFIFAGAAFGAYKLGQKQEKSPVAPLPSASPSNPSFLGVSTKNETVQKILSYNLPSGWQTVRDQSGTFEIGFDPRELKVGEVKDKYIFLAKIEPTKGASFNIWLVPYDGGPRHKFIFKQLNQDPDLLSSEDRKYEEQDYLYNGKSGLVFYDYSVSQIGNVGMLDAGEGKAFFFNGFLDQPEMEKYLGTIRFLK